MKCPLLAMGAVAISSTVEGAESDCLQEECAWWDKDNEQCALLTLSTGMWLVNQELLRIIEKMPQAVPLARKPD